MTLDPRENPCGGQYEHDAYTVLCNLEDGHKPPHESAWFEWPDGSRIREQWTDAVRDSNKSAKESS